MIQQDELWANAHLWYPRICVQCVYKNHLSRQTESRNLTGPKTLPTIWHTYMKLVTKYQISAINSCWEKCDEIYLGRTDGRRTEGRTDDGRKDGRMDGRTDRGKTVYPLRWSGGIIMLPTKCWFICAGGFKGNFFLEMDKPETRIAYDGHVC